ncbi:MAG: ABC transporter ATP-binding protein [Bacteroidota bacterium]
MLGLLFVTASNLFAVFPAQSVRIAIDLIQENLNTYRLFTGSSVQQELYHQVEWILIYFSILVFCFALIKGAFMFLMRQTLIVMSRLVEYDLKNDIFNHYQQLSLSFYRKNNTGDLMARISEDVGRVRMYIGPALMYTMNLVVTIILVLWAMFSVNVKLSFYVLIPLPILSYSIFYVNTIIHKRSDAIQSQLSRVTSFVQEAFSGIRVIKAFAVEDFSKEDFEAYSDEYRNRSLDLAKVDATFFPLMMFLTGLSTLITISVGGMLVIAGEISIGNIAEFVIYVNMLMWPVASLGVVTSMIQRASASQERINQFLETKPDIISDNNSPFAFQKSIEFKSVNFCYSGKIENAVSDLSFTINKGETIAILGSTGSGKSTIVQLLLRMMDVSSGEILIDGNNIKSVNLKAYKEHIGYVPQDVFLFSDSISGNISFGLKDDKNSFDMVVKASDDAALTSNVQSFSEGFKTVIGERGITLSGGQKQRMSIARAFIKDPDILLLDDCLSAVDNKTESEILENIERITQNKTAIIISHRVSTVKNAGKILVLDKGRIVESGTHVELMQLQQKYADIYQRQLMEEIV